MTLCALNSSKINQRHLFLNLHELLIFLFFSCRNYMHLLFVTIYVLQRFIKLEQILLHIDSMEMQNGKRVLRIMLLQLLNLLSFSRLEKKINQSKSRFGLEFPRSTAI